MIRPITSTISAQVSMNANQEIPDKYLDLIKEWEVWQYTMPAGRGEYRETAVARLKDCLTRRSPLLDLSGLQLIKLPEHYPDFLEELLVNRNRLCCIPEALPE